MGSLQPDATKQPEKDSPTSGPMLRFHWSMSSAGEKMERGKGEGGTVRHSEPGCLPRVLPRSRGLPH
jgi:hypothetical protein